MMYPNLTKRNSGFTLVEMMVVVSIAAILISIAVPSYSALIKSNRLSSGTNEFISALLLARSEALKRSTSVSVCASTDQASCSSGTDFSKGWVIFTDCDADGSIDSATCPDIDGDGTLDDEETIKVHDSLNGLSIEDSGSPKKNFVSYTFAGRSAAITFDIKAKGSTSADKQIKTSMTGRVRSCDGTCP